MCDKANLASETIKNEYKSNIAYYTERLFESSIEERSNYRRIRESNK